MRFVVQKDRYTCSKHVWMVVDQGDTGWVCGRFTTKRDATAHANLLNDRWGTCTNDDWMVDTVVV